MFTNLHIILHNLRFPENAGMAARACANMGATNLCLVSPRNWDALKAWPVATSCGRAVLNNIKIFTSLEAALAPCHLVYGSSARKGGWRISAERPAVACAKIASALGRRENVAILFGPEDSGLDNKALSLCAGIIHIETAPDACSLNIAQALLLILYELRLQCENRCQMPPQPALAAFAEQQALETTLKAILHRLDCLAGKNPDYAFRQWHGLLARKGLRLAEYHMLMGLCRQLEIMLGKCPNDKN